MPCVRPRFPRQFTGRFARKGVTHIITYSLCVLRFLLFDFWNPVNLLRPFSPAAQARNESRRSAQREGGCPFAAIPTVFDPKCLLTNISHYAIHLAWTKQDIRLLRAFPAPWQRTREPRKRRTSIYQPRSACSVFRRSCPQAASMSWPFSLRKVTLAFSRSNAARKASWAGSAGRSQGRPSTLL